MPIYPWSPLLDVPPLPAGGYGRLADRLASLLGTGGDLLLVQGEAIVALEAVASSLSRPTISALNVVTSPYGRWFGGWLRRGGASVTEVAAPAGLPVSVDAVTAALSAMASVDIVALVHAESASGILNPLPEIAELAHRRGAMVVVDAVASFGGHSFEVDALGVDIAVVGPQKSLGGSAGLSAVAVSRRAWELLDVPDAPQQSVLSLVDLRRHWLQAGRSTLPGMPSALEFHTLAATLDRVETEGLSALIERHALAGMAARAGLVALGLPLWVEAAAASNLVTAAILPPGIALADLLAILAPLDSGIEPAAGDLSGRLVRINHTGRRANFACVLASVIAYGRALALLGQAVDIGGAAAAIAASYAPQA